MLTAEPNPTTSTSETATPPANRLTPEQMSATRRCLAILGVLSTGSMIGVSFSLYLVGHYPLLLVALSPLGRHVVLAAPVANPVALIVITAVRRMAFYLSCFYLGRALGPAGIPWIEKRAARTRGAQYARDTIRGSAPDGVAVLLRMAIELHGDERRMIARSVETAAVAAGPEGRISCVRP